MADPNAIDTTGSNQPAYPVVLTCPVCALASPQDVLRARVVLPLTVPGRPFHRAFGWAEEIDRLALSPLHHGLCLCPHCGYPGADSDFRPESGQTQANTKTVRRIFMDEGAGTHGPIPEILGMFPPDLPEPERSIRLLLAAIRAEMLPYPELWRKRELGRLYLHLAWLYLDESHLDWRGRRRAEPPVYCDSGPNQARLFETLSCLAPLRATWPEIPLDEQTACNEALRYHSEVYQTRIQELAPEEMVMEERQLGELHGLVGQRETASSMLTRARHTCLGLRLEALEKQRTLFEDMSFTLSDRRALSTRIQRLTSLGAEITEQITAIFGKQALASAAADATQAAKVLAASGARPGAKPPVKAGQSGSVKSGSVKPMPKGTPARSAKPAPKPAPKKRRFGIFG